MFQIYQIEKNKSVIYSHSFSREVLKFLTRQISLVIFFSLKDLKNAFFEILCFNLLIVSYQYYLAENKNQ